jgi:ketosteroid isomerase-like protein
MTTSGLDTILRYMESWNRLDANDCAYGRATSPGHRFPRFEGRAAIRERIAGFMEAVPDLHVEVTRIAEDRDGNVWREWHLMGTHTAGWGRWAARGERVDVPAVSIYRMKDGLVAHEAEYLDPAVMMTPPD